MLDTRPLLQSTDFPKLSRQQVDILQVNLGYLCNLSCTHCHVNAGPKRTELMDKPMIDLVVSVLKSRDIKVLDLTGGAPEMNPHFRELVRTARSLGVEVIDRCNLTILLYPGFEDLAEFLADHTVNVSASLPCYSRKNVDLQRGKGVFEDSIKGLKVLNQLGYGVPGSGLELNLVYNPGGAFLPPPQGDLEAQYKQALREDFGLEFNHLHTITNMPISRFGSMLLSKNIYDEYMRLLKENFSHQNLETVMCKNLISVDWQGYLYDCDFNQMLDMPLSPIARSSELIATSHKRPHLKELMQHSLDDHPIRIGEHCYGCTAGQGSSCGGAL